MKQFIFTETGEYRRVEPNEYYKSITENSIYFNNGINPTKNPHIILKREVVESPKEANDFFIKYLSEEGHFLTNTGLFNIPKPKPKTKVYKWLCETLTGIKVDWVTKDFFSKEDIKNLYRIDKNGVGWTGMEKYTPILETMKEV